MKSFNINKINLGKSIHDGDWYKRNLPDYYTLPFDNYVWECVGDIKNLAHNDLINFIKMEFMHMALIYFLTPVDNHKL